VKDKDKQAPAMVEDGPVEKLKKRAQDLGLIVNAGVDQKRGTIDSQTKTTRRLDRTVKQKADEEMARKKKAVERWENEGGSTKRMKKGGKK
jgi:phage tail tape-measure protein